MYVVTSFMKYARVYAAQTTLLNTNIKPGFPSFADEVAEPRPDMNIKVAAITAIKEFYYTLLYLSDQSNWFMPIFHTDHESPESPRINSWIRGEL